MNQNYKACMTPCYIVQEAALQHNLEILKGVSERTGCKILLAQKAFSMFAEYPMIGKYLSGTTASGLYEARLGREEMGGEVHVFMPAYPEAQFDELLTISDHIVFNSFSQWRKYRGRVMEAKAAGREISCGLRINPEYAEVETDIYNPCAPGSRLGITCDAFCPDELEGIDGLHFHALCEQGAEVLERVLAAARERFGEWFGRMKWINFGGGHHITKPDYNIPVLERCVKQIQEAYNVQVYLEPGEAVALDAGVLVTQVLDIVDNGIKTAILDTSAACHMPDVLEMPYRPPLSYDAAEGVLTAAGRAGEQAYTYRLGGPTCLAGDIIGDYSFDHELQPGERLVFGDMAIYSMVKNNTFNGMPLPAIYRETPEGELILVKQFGYRDFKERLS